MEKDYLNVIGRRSSAKKCTGKSDSCKLNVHVLRSTDLEKQAVGAQFQVSPLYTSSSVGAACRRLMRTSTELELIVSSWEVHFQQYFQAVAVLDHQNLGALVRLETRPP
jgi:hypothetical protein